MSKLTPLRRQYLEVKRRYPEAILFFQLGDFFETFDADAEIVARELGIALTSREMGKGVRVPLAGVPCHNLEHHLAKLIHKGYKVAVCEQLTPPGKKLIPRDVTRVITPGTVLEPSLLEVKKNNYLASLVVEENKAGIAYVDITTSEFYTTQLASQQALSELDRIKPSELLVPKSFERPALGVAITPLDDQCFDFETARQALLEHFEAKTLRPYGCQDRPLAVRAAGAILYYLRRYQQRALKQLTRLSTYSTESFMALDPQTLRNLEIFQSTSGLASDSLLSVIDLTRTPMGGRRLRKWLRQPLLDLREIVERQDAVEWFCKNPTTRSKVVGSIARLSDLERLINRARAGIITPRELIALSRGLQVVPEIKRTLEEGEKALGPFLRELDPCADVTELICGAIVEDPPATPEQGEIIKEGYSKELDQLRSLLKSSKTYLADMERRERARTGIRSLRVSYNKVFGYYIEVTKPNLHMVPSDYIRKQTLVSTERFFTMELKEHELLISNAQDRILELEASLFQQICRRVGARRNEVMSTADALAHLDVFSALAEAAVRNDYARPKLSDRGLIRIKAGRHPVVEQRLKGTFVPNDIELADGGTSAMAGGAQIIILTGANMSGKSTTLRQVALIVLLAQIGSFVPAREATIGLTDRIFTRAGLQDLLAQGQSSFMLEMSEMASILNNATPGSLIILDELGRGTSTYDGLSIARAIVEYLHNHPSLRARTLFATHYHELTELAETLPRVRNFHVAVNEENGNVVFLHKVLPGRADSSYGIHVAKLAGLPKPVVHRAEEIMSEYETGAGGLKSYDQHQACSSAVHESAADYQPSPAQSGAVDDLLKLDINAMSPVEALTKLHELQKKLSNERGQEKKLSRKKEKSRASTSS